MEGQVRMKTVQMMINTALTRQDAENNQNNLENFVTKSNKIITDMHSPLSKTVELEIQDEDKTQNTREQEKKENPKALNIMQSAEGTPLNVDTLDNDVEHTILPQTHSTTFMRKILSQKPVKSWASKQVEEIENIETNQEIIASS